MNDIAQQAHNGRVIAIIQLINEQMTDLGVKTRAVFTQNVLQILCEARKAESLEQSTIVAKIQGILESISPRNIHRVRINSRILQEQQLLWLEEITQDPENHLLWSEEIILKKPNLFQQGLNTLQILNPHHTPVKRQASTQQVLFQGGLINSLVVVGVLGLIGFLLYQGLQLQGVENLQSNPKNEVKVSPSPLQPLSSEEQFTQGVKLAQEAVAEGQVADTRQEWLEIAQKWEQAANYMAGISPDFDRYATAQNRAALYRRNQEQAQRQADVMNN